jgi:murein DD-endopeptidase MepM/ murein hydrolase activator NlpD
MTVWGNGTAKKPAVSGSGKFGAPRPGGRTHAGADFIGYSDLKAIEAGRVTFAGVLTEAAGQTIAIDLPDKISGCTVTIVRMHIAKNTFKVGVGDQVRAGQSIGTMGATGNAEGDCDHVEIRFWKNDVLQKVLDPEVWIAGRVPMVAALGAGTATRKAKAFSNARTKPSTEAPIQPTRGVPAGVVGTFDGFTHGESVEGNDIWFHGAISHLWFWSGAFTDPSPTGLKKL